MLRFLRSALALTILAVVTLAAACAPAGAQSFRFTLRAEPEVIPANGISTSSIFVQLPSDFRSGGAISATPTVRFATTAGVIESTAVLQGGVARVLLRSSTTPGTAMVTAFVGSSREAVTVEFTTDNGLEERYLEVAAPYVAYGSDSGLITSAGKSSMDFGDLRIESDTRMDVDLMTERVWAQGSVIIRQRRGRKVNELRGDRLYYDLRRRRGVMRRGDTSQGVARQEFVGADFSPPAPEDPNAVPAKEPDSKNGRLMNERPVVQVPTPEPSVAIEPQPGETELHPAPNTEVPGETETDATAQPADPTQTRATALVTVPREGQPSADPAPQPPPPYSPLPTDDVAKPLIVELPPPEPNVTSGYWVASKSLRVFPRQRVQFQRATVYFNGGKVFHAPLYVLPLDGSFNPTTDTLSFNSEGGLTLKFPVYYQASRNGTGALYIRHDPGAGYSTGKPGFSLALDHQYHFSSNSSGELTMDQLGRGSWNLNLHHEMKLNPTTHGDFYFSSPRHRDLYANASLTKELRAMQIGIEGYYDQPEGEKNNMRGQFFVRMRPKSIGKGWSHNMSANILGVRSVSSTITDDDSSIPGRDPVTRTITRPLFGQTFTTGLQSPIFSPWRGGTFSANLFTTAYNYSDGRRGVTPGISMGFGQNLGRAVSMRLDYTYDRSALGLYGVTSGSYTHYISGALSAQLAKNVSLSSFASKSLSDDSLYGSTDLDYYISDKWRVGLFSDYSNFTDSNSESVLNYGWSLGRKIGQREVSVNFDASRGKVYFELGGFRY